MKNEKIKEIADKLVLLNDKQLQTVKEEVESFIEPNPVTPREELFDTIKNIIYECSDVNIQTAQEISIGVGITLLYDNRTEEQVSLCYLFDNDHLELHVNGEAELIIDRTSPILEAFKALFENYIIDEKIEC